MPLHGTLCYNTHTHRHTRETTYDVCAGQRGPGYIAIVVAIKYIVLEGVFYNGFLLFIKTEGSL